jgi:hypothetical protein
LNAVAFDERTHTYRVGGAIVPSVTTILDAVLGDGFNHDPAAAEFGNHVHKAVALYLRGRLNWNELDPALVPYVHAAAACIRDNDITVIDVERIVSSIAPRYCGTLDLYGHLRGRHSAVLDWKTGGRAPYVGSQLAAYAHGHKVPNARRYAVVLAGDGTYAMHECTDPADWSLFVSALNIYQWKAKR